MLFTLPDTAAIATRLENARLRRCAIDPPRELAELSLREAYDVQDALVAYREAAGAVRSGWKLGLTSRVKQRQLNLDFPLFGQLFADGEIVNSRNITASGLIAPLIEPELAFGLSGSLDPEADPARLMGVIAWVAPALEIKDSRYRPGRRTAVELVADNLSAAAYVIGGRVSLESAPRLDAIGTQLIRNGSVLAAGTTAGVLGDPFNALRSLARHLAERGQHAGAGDIVLSGAITDAFPISLGDRVVARLRGLGTASVAFT